MLEMEKLIYGEEGFRFYILYDLKILHNFVMKKLSVKDGRGRRKY